MTAADEALAISCSEYGAQNTLHFYRRILPAISVGYFSKLAEDIDLKACDALGILIVRRASGGGAIYTDKDQLIFSIITGHSLGKNIEDSFRQTCSCVIDALEACGITATFKPPNDVLVNNKKVSGSAQVKKKKAYLTHGTIILKLEHNIIQRVLKNARQDYTSSIQQECGVVPKIDVLKNALRSALQNRFQIQCQNGEFSKPEKQLIQELIKNKYGTRAWNFKR